MENAYFARLVEQGERELRLMKRQLFWCRLFGLCGAAALAATAVCVVFALPLVTQARGVLDSVEGYTVLVDGATDELTDITETLGVVSDELRGVDYGAVVDNLVKTSEALGAIDWPVIAEDLTVVSAQLSEIDWKKLAEDIDSTAVTAQESMEETLDALSALDLDSLNRAIGDLQTIVEPLAGMVKRLNGP